MIHDQWSGSVQGQSIVYIISLVVDLTLNFLSMQLINSNKSLRITHLERTVGKFILLKSESVFTIISNVLASKKKRLISQRNSQKST